MRMTRGIAIAVLALACGPASGQSMSKKEYQAAKKRIEAEYTAERQKCGPRYGNALDECVARAHGTRDVAKAELEAQYKPSPRTNYNAAIARANAAYKVAKEECDEKSGPARKACMKDAKAASERATAEAKAARKASQAEEAAKGPVR